MVDMGIIMEYMESKMDDLITSAVNDAAAYSVIEDAELAIGQLSRDVITVEYLNHAVTVLVKLIVECKGPDQFDTWRDAAVAERLKRIEVEKQMARQLDLAQELRAWFNSDLLNKNTDLYLLLEEVDAATKDREQYDRR